LGEVRFGVESADEGTCAGTAGLAGGYGHKQTRLRLV
jgi:hypothetical protein